MSIAERGINDGSDGLVTRVRWGPWPPAETGTHLMLEERKGTDAPKTEVGLCPGPEKRGRRASGVFSLKYESKSFAEG